MTRLPDRFTEDRRLRDAARAVLIEDIEQLRASLSQQGIAARVSSGVSATISSRIRSGARDVLAQARAQAGDHKGVIALVVGAIVLWLARGAILDWLTGLDDAPDDTDDIADAAAAPAPEPAPAPAATTEGEPA